MMLILALLALAHSQCLEFRHGQCLRCAPPLRLVDNRCVAV